MGTVKFAHFPGRCAVCGTAYSVNARIANTPYGWGHDDCVGIWRAKRAEALVAASGVPARTR